MSYRLSFFCKSLHQRILILLILLINTFDFTKLNAQQQVDWIYSDYVEYDLERYGKVRRAIGSVQFRHEGTYLFCDSAFFYEESNRIEAYSNVHVQDSDTLNLFCDFLIYEPEFRKAVANDNVVLIDPQIELTTDQLTYKLNDRLAFYTTGGKIVSSTNTLTSKKGWYYVDDKHFIFESDVVLDHSRFILHSDTLHYTTTTEVAKIYGPTTIYSEENIIYSELGIYDTQKDLAWLWKNSSINNEETTIKGDSIFYDRNKSFSEAYRNVTVTDTVSKYVIGGHYGEYDEFNGYSLMTDSSWAIFFDEGDSLLMIADTLLLLFDSLMEGETFTGYNNVLFYRDDFQGACDSILYNFADSTIFMFESPVIWFSDTQIISDTILMYIRDEELREIDLLSNVFIISEDLDKQYNQVKGRNAKAFFSENRLSVMHVLNNVETVYYVREEDSTLIGIDKAISDELRIEFEDGEIILTVYIGKVTGTTYTENNLQPADRRLRGFYLRDKERPTSKEGLLKRRK